MYRNTQTKMTEATIILLWTIGPRRTEGPWEKWRELTTNPGMELLAGGAGGVLHCGKGGMRDMPISLSHPFFIWKANYPTKNAGSLEDCCPYLPLVITNLVKGRTPNHGQWSPPSSLYFCMYFQAQQLYPIFYRLDHGHSLQVILGFY